MHDRRARRWICILAHCSEQFLLSEQECDILVDLSLAHVGSRKAVMITCKHFSTQFAIERVRYAAARGASLLMLMPPYHGVSLNADAPSVLDRFGRIADAAKISILVLNALLSGVTLTMSFLVRLAREMPRFGYFNT